MDENFVEQRYAAQRDGGRDKVRDKVMVRRRLSKSRRRQLCRVVLLLKELSIAVDVDLRRFDPHLTTNSAIVVLAELQTHGPRRPRALRQVTAMTTGGMSNLLRRMQAAGAITRRASAFDRDDRAVRVELTDLGRQIEREITTAMLGGLRDCDVTMKELLTALDRLGARRPPITADHDRQASGSRLVMAMAAAGGRLRTALDTPHSDLTASLVLIALEDGGPCRPRYLADRLDVTSAGMAKVLDRLQSEQLVERSVPAETDDRRAVSVGLTPLGVALVDTILSDVAVHLDELASAVAAVSTVFDG